MNKVIAIGNLGKEVKFIDGQVKIASFPIAVNERTKAGERTEWINCVAFGRLAEICHDYLDKGDKIAIDGRLQTRSWEDDKGNKRYSTEVILNGMDMLSSKKEKTNSSESTGAVPNDADIPY